MSVNSGKERKTSMRCIMQSKEKESNAKMQKKKKREKLEREEKEEMEC